jgi:hypothetical protein
VQANADKHSRYIETLKKAQESYQIHPVVWNKGKCVSVPPLSPLHLRIGLHSVPANDEIEVRGSFCSACVAVVARSCLTAWSFAGSCACECTLQRGVRAVMMFDSRSTHDLCSPPFATCRCRSRDTTLRLHRHRRRPSTRLHEHCASAVGQGGARDSSGLRGRRTQPSESLASSQWAAYINVAGRLSWRCACVVDLGIVSAQKQARGVAGAGLPTPVHQVCCADWAAS